MAIWFFFFGEMWLVAAAMDLARGAPGLADLLRRHRRLLRPAVPRHLHARVFRFFGEALRQAGILIIGSALVIWGLAFILGLQCGIEGAYFCRSVGAPANAGVFAAWCDLREVMPYAFGYMMSAKVGTGLVAEIGAMRISDEIDALEVMGIDSLVFLCATRLLAAWMVLPFMYIAAIGAGFFASYLAVVQQIGEVSSGGYFLIFWMFQNPPDLAVQPDQGDGDGDGDRARRLLLRLHRLGRAGGVGTATAKSMVLNTVLVHLIGMIGHADLLGLESPGPDRRLSGLAEQVVLGGRPERSGARAVVRGHEALEAAHEHGRLERVLRAREVGRGGDRVGHRDRGHAQLAAEAVGAADPLVERHDARRLRSPRPSGRAARRGRRSR